MLDRLAYRTEHSLKTSPLRPLTRPTFYQHAPDVNALARRAALAGLETALTEPPDFAGLGTVDVARVSALFSEHLRPLLDHLEIRRAFYRNLLDHAGSPDLCAELTSMLAARADLVPVQPQWGIAAIGHGAISEVITGGLVWRVIG